jgi:hypothetical protein
VQQDIATPCCHCLRGKLVGQFACLHLSIPATVFVEYCRAGEGRWRRMGFWEEEEARAWRREGEGLEEKTNWA